MERQTNSCLQFKFNLDDGNEHKTHLFPLKTYKQFNYYPYEKNKLIASGIILYDKTYIYFISEKRKDKTMFIDMGGKFEIEDYDIFQTAAREFCEETFFTIPISYFTLLKLNKTNKLKKIYISYNKKTRSWQYLSFLINIEHIENIENWKFDKESVKLEIENRRKNYLNLMNNNMRLYYISTISFHWAERKNFTFANCSERLIEIIKSSDLLTNK